MTHWRNNSESNRRWRLPNRPALIQSALGLYSLRLSGTSIRSVVFLHSAAAWRTELPWEYAVSSTANRLVGWGRDDQGARHAAPAPRMVGSGKGCLTSTGVRGVALGKKFDFRHTNRCIFIHLCVYQRIRRIICAACDVLITTVCKFLFGLWRPESDRGCFRGCAISSSLGASF